MLQTKSLNELLFEEHAKVMDSATGLLKPEVRETVTCPVCGADDSTVFWVKDGFVHVKCSHCQFIYVNPRLNEQALAGFYTGTWTRRYNCTKFSQTNLNKPDDRENRRNLLEIARIVKEGRLLEIGCGTGYFLQVARDEFGFDTHGVEIDSETSDICRRQKGLNVITGTLAQANYPVDFFDVVYMRTVLEHIPEPQMLLKQIYRVMKPSGLVVIEVPNVKGLVYDIAKERHTCVFGFEHLNWFSEDTLERILNQTGFRVIQTKRYSIDLKISAMADYLWGQPTFTSVDHKQNGTGSLPFMGAIYIAQIAFSPIDWLIQRLASIIKKESIMAVYAMKCRK